MSDATGRSRVRDVYVGQTFGSLLDDILDQDGAQDTASEEDKSRIRRWIGEALEQMAHAIGVAGATQRSLSLTTESGTSRYALDYDVARIEIVLDGNGKQARVMDLAEAREQIDRGSGGWPLGSTLTLVWEELDKSGRMVVRLYPAPTDASTYTVWYTPKVCAIGDREKVLPLPGLFHPAVEEYCLSKLFRRQEDSKQREQALAMYEKMQNDARARYRPLGPVDECFRSAYADRPGFPRGRGRISRGN